MNNLNWNLVPAYCTYILTPPLSSSHPVLLPTLQQVPTLLQQQLPTLHICEGVNFVQNANTTSQFPASVAQQITTNNACGILKNPPRNIAPKPTLRDTEQVGDFGEVDVKEEPLNEEERWEVKEESEEIKMPKVADVAIRNEKNDFVPVDVKREKEDSDCQYVDDYEKTKKTKRILKDTDIESVKSDEMNHEEEQKSNSKKPRKGNILTCDHCPYTTTWKGNLTKHVISKHTSSEAINWLQCDHCPYKGKTKDYLKCHLLHVHAVKVKWFDCPHCDFRAKLKCLLDRHTIRKHPESTQIQWLECGQCPYRAKFKNNLKEHILNKHTAASQIRWLHCAHCKFKAKRKRNLKFHMLNRHTAADEVKWFQCKFCPYRMFKRGSALKKHVAVLHKDEEELQKKEQEQMQQKQEDNLKKSKEDESGSKRRNVKLETKEIPVFIDNRLCWRRIVVGLIDDEDSFTCSQCDFHSTDKTLFKQHILKFHVVTELKQEDKKIVKTSYKTKDITVMMDDGPCIKRVVVDSQSKIEEEKEPRKKNQEEDVLKETSKDYARNAKLETKEIPVFIDNRLCWKKINVEADGGDPFKCPQCLFQSTNKEVFKNHILKNHVVTELKREDDEIVKTSYKTKDVIVMMNDKPCVRRIVDHPLSNGET